MQLQLEIALNRNPVEGIVEVMNRPLALTYPDDASLEQVLKDIKMRSTGPAKASGWHPDLRRSDRALRGGQDDDVDRQATAIRSRNSRFAST